MRKPLLVGIRHDLDRRLLDRGCRKRFAKEIFPLIDRNALLVLEGSHRESFCREGDPLYNIERKKAEKFIGTAIKHPVIGWCDGRWKKSRRWRGVRQLLDIIDYERHNVTPLITLPARTPATFAELCDAFVHSRVSYEMDGRPWGTHME